MCSGNDNPLLQFAQFFDTIPKMDTTEIIGLVASALVLVSFLFKHVRTIRLINIVGCIVFVMYGVLIGALSIWLFNGTLIFVHIYLILRMRKSKLAQNPSPDRRLQKFTRSAFNKKGLREMPWFITSDLE